MLVNAELENRRVKRMLSSQPSATDASTTGSGPSPVTDQMVKSAILASSYDRILSLLPRQYKPAPAQSVAMASRNKPNAYDKIRLPLIPIKKHISWLSPALQDAVTPTYTLSDEIYAFVDYVSVCFYPYIYYSILLCVK